MQKRAVKGSITGRIPLSLTGELRADAERAALAAGVSLAEWIRGAMALRLRNPAVR